MTRRERSGRETGRFRSVGPEGLRVDTEGSVPPTPEKDPRGRVRCWTFEGRAPFDPADALSRGNKG